MGRRFPKQASDNSLNGITGVSKTSQFEKVVCTVLVPWNPSTHEHVEDFEMPEAYRCLNFLVQHFPNGPEQGAFGGRVLVNENTGIGYVFLYKRCWAPASVISAETRGVARALQDLCEKAKRRGVGRVLWLRRPRVSAHTGGGLWSHGPQSASRRVGFKCVHFCSFLQISFWAPTISQTHPRPWRWMQRCIESSSPGSCILVEGGRPETGSLNTSV